MHKLDNLKLIKKLDCSDMLGFISGLPEQCSDAYEIGISSSINKPDSKIDNIIFAGVGGSGIGADLISSYLRGELKVPVSICRNYTLPDFTGPNTLLLCLSYSGNTEEALSCFEQGIKKNAFIITIGSGGKLKELSLKNNISNVSVPAGYPPRSAIGYMSITLLGVLEKLGFIKSKRNEIKDLFSSLSSVRDQESGMAVPAKDNISKKIAVELYKRYAVIYGATDLTDAVSSRWREQIAENSKALSSSHALPEMNHNEIVGWRFPERLLKDFRVVMLSDNDDHPRIKERARISEGIIKKTRADVIVLKRHNGGRLARIYSLVYIGDFASFYLAILNNIDPTPVDSIDYLKKELAKI